MQSYVSTTIVVFAVAQHFCATHRNCYSQDLDPLPKPGTIINVGPSNVYPSNAGNQVAVIPDSQGETPFVRGMMASRHLHIKDWPRDWNVRHVAFSSDDSKVLFVCADQDSTFSALWVDTATGTVLRTVRIPESLVSCTAVRYSDNDAYIAGHSLFRVNESSGVVTTVDANVASYISDVATLRENVSYVDFLGLHLMGRFGAVVRQPVKLPLGPLLQDPHYSIDISRDGKYILAGSSADKSSTIFSSAVVTYEIATGKPVSTINIPGVAKRVRFIGDGYAYVVLEMTAKSHAATRVHVFSKDIRVGSWQFNGHREHNELLSVTSNSGVDAHLSVGSDDGTVVQWRRRDLTAALARKLFDRDH
ncbi:MAG: hypothetical protein WCJ09_25390 [Planctomycetota bacterium]